MNEWRFNDTPAQKLHWLLGVKQRFFHETYESQRQTERQRKPPQKKYDLNMEFLKDTAFLPQSDLPSSKVE